jgi:hypothetical protein
MSRAKEWAKTVIRLSKLVVYGVNMYEETLLIIIIIMTKDRN